MQLYISKHDYATLREMFYDAEQNIDALRDAHSLDPWNMTPGMHRMVTQCEKRLERYRKLRVKLKAQVQGT